MPLAECRACPKLIHCDNTAVECEPSAPFEILARQLAHDPRLGAAVSVGQVMGGCAVSVVADAEATSLVSDFEGICGSILFAIVVDRANRFVGLMDRRQAVMAKDGDSARCLARAVTPVQEASSLAEAIARMASEHVRALPVVDIDGNIVGLISDLDALRWVAAQAQ